MKILVAGLGMLGSQVAFTLAWGLQPETLMLYDIKDLSGHLLDLQPALKGLGVKTKVTTKIEPADYVVITAGRATSQDEAKRGVSEGELFGKNVMIMGDIINRFGNHSDPWMLKEKQDKPVFIVMTNPVLKITNAMQDYWPSLNITNPEAELMELRGGKELGRDIIATKGYTDQSAAVSCLMKIRKLEAKR